MILYMIFNQHWQLSLDTLTNGLVVNYLPIRLGFIYLFQLASYRAQLTTESNWININQKRK